MTLDATLEVQQNPVTFLLVDDQEENLTALEALLDRDDLRILTARSGMEALEILLKQEIALALLDVHMPDMDGFELAELMRGTERSRHVPIIFVTANPTEQNHIFQGYDAGAVDFLVKPIDPRILRHKVGTFFELAKQRRQIAETLRMNEMFAAQVGHDLKNPLNSIVMTSRLIEASASDAGMKKHAARLVASSMHMARMVDDLFDLSRVRLGDGLPINRTAGDAHAVTKKAVDELATAKPNRVIRFEALGSVLGEWDLLRFGQVVSNLVGNALQHGAQDEPVDVSLREDGTDVVLAVHNAGSIPPAFLAKIFDPFRSAQMPRQRHGGLGLGLYIVKQIVMTHGGRIDVRSTDAEGTTFVVRLPKLPTRKTPV